MLNRRELLQRAALLTGGAIATPTLLGLLHSCSQENRLSYTPKYFTEDEARFVTSYVDTLLPRTDTPGGLDVGVDVFIDKVMAETSPKGDGPSDMQRGILEFEDIARSTHNNSFASLTSEQRNELFTAAEERSARYNPQVWGTAVGEEPPIDFYRSFKSMVLWGYLSSEKIGTEVLNYDPVPGGYDGDIALSSVGGKSWSL